MLAFVVTTAVAVEVTPDSWEREINAGESFSKEISVENTGNEPVLASLYTYVDGELGGEGFDISYDSSGAFVVEDEKTVEMSVETSTALKPGNYSFETVVDDVEVSEVVEEVYRDRVRVVEEEVSNVTNVTEEEIFVELDGLSDEEILHLLNNFLEENQLVSEQEMERRFVELEEHFESEMEEDAEDFPFEEGDLQKIIKTSARVFLFLWTASIITVLFLKKVEERKQKQENNDETLDKDEENL